MDELKKTPAKKPAAKKKPAASTAEIKSEEQLEVAATPETVEQKPKKPAAKSSATKSTASKSSAKKPAQAKTEEQSEVAAATETAEQKPKKSAAKSGTSKSTSSKSGAAKATAKKPAQAKAEVNTEDKTEQSEAAATVDPEIPATEQAQTESASSEQKADVTEPQAAAQEEQSEEQQSEEQQEQAEQPESHEQKADNLSDEHKKSDAVTKDKKSGKKSKLSKKTIVILSCVLAVVLIAVIIVVSVISCNSGADMYTVTFDTLGGTPISSYKLEAGSKINRPSKDPTKEMFTFDDWYWEVTNSNGVKERQKFKFGTTISQNITLYAGWIGEKSIQIEFNPNGGQFADGDVVSSVVVGSQVSEPEQKPTRFGYVFDGWYTDADCDNKYQFSSFLVNDTTLYAGWAKSDDFAYVSYYGNGELLQIVPVEKDSNVVVPELFMPKDDIVTTGWYTDEQLSKPYTFGKATEDVSLYTTYYTSGLIINNVTVTGYDGNATDIVIPSVYNGRTVTTIGESAFLRPNELTGSITSVTLPATINRIGDKAFHNCQYLASINLTNNVTYIGADAFYKNKRLRTVGDMSGVTNLGEGAFNGCEQLREVTLNNRMESIRNYAFNDCKLLTNVTVPASVMTIGEYAFSGCTSLKTVVVESLVINSIGKSAFAGCTNLTEVTINKTSGAVTFAADGNPFASCRNVTIYVPSSLVDEYKNNPNNESFKDKFAAIR